MSLALRDLLKFSAPVLVSAALLSGCGSGSSGSADLDKGDSVSPPPSPLAKTESFDFKSPTDWFVSGTAPTHARFSGGQATDAGDGYWIIPEGVTGVVDFGTPADAVKFSTEDDFTPPAAAAGAGKGAPPIGSQKVDAPFDVPMYIRGSVRGDWASLPENQLIEVSDNVLAVTIPMEPGDYAFKVANGGGTWVGTTNCGAVNKFDPVPPTGAPFEMICGNSSQDMGLAIATAGNYKFTFDVTGADKTKAIVKVALDTGGGGGGGDGEEPEDSTLIRIHSVTVVASAAGPAGVTSVKEVQGLGTLSVDELRRGGEARITRIEIENLGTNGDIGVAAFDWTSDAQFALASQAVDIYYTRPTGSVAGTTITVGGQTYACASAPTPASPNRCVASGVVVTPYANATMTVRNADTSTEQIIFNGGSGAEDVSAYSGSTYAGTGTPPMPSAITQSQAHWVTAGTLLWNPPEGATSVELLFSPNASIATGTSGLTGTYQTIPLTSGTNPQPPFNKQLWTYKAWSLGAAAANAKEIARGQLIAVARDQGRQPLAATRVQIAGALDDLYAAAAYDEPLGVTYASGVPSLAVWAPTALRSPGVTLNIYDDAADTTAETVAMTLDETTGIWKATGTAAWNRKFYTLSLRVFSYASNTIVDNTVTDPYSVSLATDSVRSQFVNLDDEDLKPEGWDTLVKPALAAPEDTVIYELHVRDFSAADTSVPAEHRGKYTAFDLPGTQGRQHLKQLAEAGLTHVHLLPVFDIATVKENRADRVEIDDPVERLCEKNSAAANLCVTDAGKTIRQAIKDAIAAGALDRPAQIAEWMRALDGFNWGYDPYHFGAPEGSYATDPNGPTRILEFRRMVKGLNEDGLRAVMDVVYNHTNESGQGAKSVLDKIVPGYYHRRGNSDGAVLGDSCCEDTASEFQMMEKLMIDTGKLWVDDYKVSGFRFDLSGFHTLDNMLRFQEAVQAIDPTTYIYGEAWNFGAVQNDARFEQARQANLGGTGIGSFADRIRDPLRGSFFGENDVTTEWIQRQGFVSGWYYDPNSENTGSVTERNGLLAATDDIRLWLAGGLKSYRLQKSDGTTVSGSQLSGYTEDPQEAIVYADKHDNATLWDYSAWKHPTGTSPANRVRAQNVGQAVILLGQGIPFVQAGSDILRSKSGDRDSYDSGDWFNEIDWTLSGNKWAEGLPIADKNDIRWPLLQTKYQDVTTKPGPAEVQRAFDHFREMLQIRKSSQLFRLRDEAQVNVRVRFYNTGPSQVPGVIAMGIDGCTDADFVPGEGALMTIFNASDEPRTLNLFGTEAWTLHPVLANSTDPVVRTARHDANGFYVPARTTAVFRRAAQTSCMPYPTDLYVRGSFNDWVNPAWSGSQMKYLGGTSYAYIASLPAGAQQFKVAARSWGDYPVCGASVEGQVVELGTPAVLTCAPTGPNLGLPASTVAGDYLFVLDATDRVNPALTVTRATDIFVRGSMNDWVNPPPDSARMRYDGFAKYRVVLSGLNAASYNFKIADKDWGASNGGATNCGASAGGATVTLGQPYVMSCPSQENMTITLPAAGSYVFAADLEYGAAPTLTVTPTTFDFSVFVRGSFNGWADPPAANTQLFEIGSGLLSRTLRLEPGDVGFKVASADWGQSLFNCGGGTVTLGSPVALTCGGSSPNTSFSVPDGGYYSFTLDANNPDAPTVTVTGP